MAYKFNTLKSIKRGLIGPNILFPAAYLLFSAEVCTGGAKNKPSNQMGQVLHASLSAKPVVLQDKVVENLEQSKDKTEESEKADLVNQSATEEEGLKESNPVDLSATEEEGLKESNPVDLSGTKKEGLKASNPVDPSGTKKEGPKASDPVDPSDTKKEGLKGSNPVDPSDTKKEGLKGSEGKTEVKEAAESVDEPKSVPLTAGGPAAPPLPVAPLVGPPASLTAPAVDSKKKKEVTKGKEGQQSAEEKPIPDQAMEKNDQRLLRACNDLTSLYHKETMNEMMSKSFKEYNVDRRSSFIQQSLKQPEDTYAYKKEEVVKWFLNDLDHKVAKECSILILKLILEQVQNNEAAYDSEKVSLLKSLTNSIE